MLFLTTAALTRIKIHVALNITQIPRFVLESTVENDRVINTQ